MLLTRLQSHQIRSMSTRTSRFQGRFRWRFRAFGIGLLKADPIIMPTRISFCFHSKRAKGSCLTTGALRCSQQAYSSFKAGAVRGDRQLRQVVLLALRVNFMERGDSPRARSPPTQPRTGGSPHNPFRPLSPGRAPLRLKMGPVFTGPLPYTITHLRIAGVPRTGNPSPRFSAGRHMLTPLNRQTPAASIRFNTQ